MKIKSSSFLNVVLAAGLVVLSAHLVSSKHSEKTKASAKSNNMAKGNSVATSAASIVYHNIMTRTSVRSYSDRPIEKAQVDSLLHAGMAAPTAMNRQPWHFVVVDDRALLASIASITPNAGMAKKAPLAIVVCGNKDKFAEGGAREMWSQDVSAATENILLQAHAMGLGAVWTGTFPSKERMTAVSTLLNLPDNLMPFCTIVIGYPDGATTPKDKWSEDNVSYNKF